MGRRRTVGLLATVALAAVVAFTLWLDASPGPDATSSGATTASAEPSAPSVSAPRGTGQGPAALPPAPAVSMPRVTVRGLTSPQPSPVTGSDAPTDGDRATPLQRHHAFRQEMRRLLETGDQLPEQQRRIEAKRLEEQIRRFEAEGQVLPTQATLLRSMLLSVTMADPQSYQAQLAALKREAREAAEERRLEAERQAAEFNAAYQSRAAAILEELMADDEFAADPIRRAAALRERLQALREDLYVESGN